MAIEGAEIVSRHIIDDTGLREGLTRNERMINESATRTAKALSRVRDEQGRFVKGFSASGLSNMRHAFAEYESQATRAGTALKRTANHSVDLRHATMALGSSLHLVTGQTGFMAVEIGRAASHVGRFVTGSGGMIAALSSLAIGAKNFLVSIGPIGWAIGITAAAFALMSREGTKSAAVVDKNADAIKRFNDLSRKTGGALDVELGKRSNADVRRMELELEFPEMAAKDLVDRGFAAMSHSRRMSEGFKGPFEFEGGIDRLIGKETAISDAKLRNATMDRTQALRLEASILRGEGAIYDLIGDRAERVATIERDRTRTFHELLRQRAELVAKSEQDDSGFGITTRSAGEFRFGQAAAGSVIGEQNETKKTNALLDKALGKLDVLIRQAGKALGGDIDVFDMDFR